MKLENSIHIDAPRETVWSVTEDIDRWSEWTPTVESIQRLDQGSFDVGSTALIKQPGQPEARWIVTSLTRGESFTWESNIRGIRVIATHELASAQNGTRNLLRIELSGFVALLLWPLIRSSVRRSIEQENTGLKKRCESLGS